MVGKILFSVEGYTNASDDMEFKINLNDLPIFGCVFNNVEPARAIDGVLTPIPILIPSYTKLTATGKRSFGTGTMTFTVLFVGRVYR